MRINPPGEETETLIRSAPYEVTDVFFDEAFFPGGDPRPGYGPLIEAITGTGPAVNRRQVGESLAVAGVEFGPEGSRTTFEVDPVPRLIGADEWRRLEPGLVQRIRALNAFLSDVYGERRIITDGVMPQRVVDEAIHFEPVMVRSPLPVVASVAGPDLIRGADGTLIVLEDNLRTPSGLAYAIAGRNAVIENPALPSMPVREIADSVEPLLETIRSTDPTGTGDPAIAVLSDGPVSNAWYEHRSLAERMGLALVTPGDLFNQDDRLAARTASGVTGIDVIYNRSSSESLRDDSGQFTALGKILAGPLEKGTLASANSFGTGVADDKAIYCYVEDMIRFYLNQEPLLHSVASYDLGDAAQFDVAMARIDQLVIKPRWSFGGHGIVIGPRATREQIDQAVRLVREQPSGFVAQEPIDLSVHPTVTDNRLEPRHIDFRPYVLTSDEATSVIPGGLTRFAGTVGDLIVNSTQGGGAKDTWVLADE